MGHREVGKAFLKACEHITNPANTEDIQKRLGGEMTKGELKRLIYQIEDKKELVEVLWRRINASKLNGLTTKLRRKNERTTRDVTS